MKISKLFLFLSLLVFAGVVNCLIIFNINFFYIRQILGFLFLLFVPGFLIFKVLKIELNDFWYKSVNIIGLSLFFMIFGGLLTNTVLPLFGIVKPLSLMPLITSFDIYLLILWLLAYILSKNNIILNFPETSTFDKTILLTALIFPILSVLGAIRLNNGGSNILTMIMLGSIAIYVLFLGFFQKKVNENIYPWSIYLISISLLLMLSLRSWHISGADIHDELRVFQITRNLGFWSTANIKHAYNACLSITVLPTILSVFTKISDEYIFKILYQIIFGIVPLTIFLIIRKYSFKIMSFLAVFYVISQPFFIQPMTALIRQETAFLFYSLLLLSIFSEKLTKRISIITTIIFGFAMIVSHYSTTYITIFLLWIAYLLFLLIKIHKTLRIKTNNYKKHTLLNDTVVSQSRLKPLVILTLSVFTFLWYSQITKSSDNLVNTMRNALDNMKNIFTSEVKNQEVSQSLSLFSFKNENTIENINDYLTKTSDRFKESSNPKYDSKSYQAYEIYPVNSSYVNPIIFSPWNNTILQFFQVLKLVTKTFVVVGTIYIILVKSVRKLIDKELITINVIGSIFIALMLIHPTLASRYNLSRIYLQVLLLLSLPAIYGGLGYFRLIPKKFRVGILGLSLVMIFLFFSGFVFQLFGGNPYMHLNNYGEDYDKFYTHSSEVLSIDWLKNNRDTETLVFSDKFSFMKLKSFGNIDNIINFLFPQIIYKNSYVYASYANIVRGKINDSFEGKSLSYNYPGDFFSNNKNLIYNNKSSIIYK